MAQTGVVSWSQTAGSNATADSNVNWSEGMAPSQVNDSARAEMASVAKWRDDLTGAVQTAGTSTAYTLTTNQSFSSFTVLDAKTLVVQFHTTCGNNPTLNIDGLGPKQLYQDGTLLPVSDGQLRNGGIYHVTYNNSNSAFILHSVRFVEPARIILHDSTHTPDGWLMCDGSAKSRSTFADLFTAIGTTYGSSDGSTFKLPSIAGPLAGVVYIISI